MMPAQVSHQYKSTYRKPAGVKINKAWILEKTKGKRFVDRENSTNTQPQSYGSSQQENSSSNRAAERILELVNVLDERNQNQTQGNSSHASNTQQFVRQNAQELEHRPQIPFRQNF